MRTHKVILEIELQDRETPEQWLKNTLGSVKYTRIKSITAVEEESKKISGNPKKAG